MFACGRIGHKKDDCLHIIRTSTSPVRGGNDDHGDSVGSRTVHDTDSIANGGGMLEGSGTAKDNDSYGPWMIVTCKKVGQRGARNSAALEGHTGSRRAEVYQASRQRPSMKPISMGWAKEAIPQKLVVSKPSIKVN